MIFLNIYIAFSLLTFILLLMQSYTLSKQLKRELPDNVKEFNKKNKTSALETIFTWIKIFVSCFVPIVNIGIFYMSLFGEDKIKEKTLNKLSR